MKMVNEGGKRTNKREREGEGEEVLLGSYCGVACAKMKATRGKYLLSF